MDFQGQILQYSIEHTEDNSELEKVKKKRPTKKLMSQLQAWHEQLMESHMDEARQEQFSEELWRIAEKFEEQIEKENKGWEMERQYVHRHFLNRERKLKETYLFRIEALESALREVKLDCRREVDRMEMTINDLESQLMNLDVQHHFQSVEDYILEQYAFIKDLGIECLPEFESPFRLLAGEKKFRDLDSGKMLNILFKGKRIRQDLSQPTTASPPPA